MFLAGRQLLSARTASATPLTIAPGIKAAVSAFSSRRYSSSSSSKPSNPADGARTLAQTATNSARRRSFNGRRTTARQMTSQLRAANMGSKSATAPPLLPFVRDTEHLKPVDISVACFFAQHRPVSVNHAFPLSFDESHFGSLLSSSPKSHAQPAPYPENSEGVAYNDPNGGESEVSVQSVRMPGGNALRIEISTMNNDYTANEYLPFRPPPAPVPMDIASPQMERNRKSRKQVIAVISAFAPDNAADIIREGIISPAILSSRLRIQQRKMEEQEKKEQNEIMEEKAEADIMQALSVKRQRRLKMKKHKLKKLRKLTRNLRRKLENR